MFAAPPALLRTLTRHACWCARQVMQAILKDKGDETEVALLYANQSPDDILLHAELQKMAADARVKVWYTGALGNALCFL